MKKILMIVYYFLVFITRTSGGGEGINSGLGREGGERGGEVSHSGGGGKGIPVDVSLVQTPKKKNVYEDSSGMQSMYRCRTHFSVFFFYILTKTYVCGIRSPLVCSLCIGVGGHIFLCVFFLHFNKNVCMWYAVSSGMESVYRRRRTHFSVFFFYILTKTYICGMCPPLVCSLCIDVGGHIF
jgi:hypothetical protein